MNTQHNTASMIHIDEEASTRFASLLADFMARNSAKTA